MAVTQQEETKRESESLKTELIRQQSEHQKERSAMNERIALLERQLEE